MIEPGPRSAGSTEAQLLAALGRTRNSLSTAGPASGTISTRCPTVPNPHNAPSKSAGLYWAIYSLDCD